MDKKQRRIMRWMVFLLLVFSGISFEAIEHYFGLPSWASLAAAGIFGGIIGAFVVQPLGLLRGPRFDTPGKR